MFTQFLFSTAIGFFIGPIVLRSGYMSWVSVILGAVIGLLLAFFAYKLAQRRPDEHFGNYGKKIMGKWLHFVVFMAALLIHLLMAAFTLRQFTDFIVQIYLPGTPNWAVAALFGICIARLVRSGPIYFFRSALGLFLFSVITVCTFPLFVAREADPDKLIALITDFQPLGIWQGMLISAALFGEMAFVIYLNPFFEEKNKTFRTLLWAGITAVVVTIVNLVATLLLFGSELTAGVTYPTLELIRYIRAGSFLENLDPLLIVFWLFSMLLKIGMFVLVGTLIASSLFGLKDPKPFSFSLSATAIFLSVFLFKSATDIERIMRHSETTILLLKDAVPALYLLVDRLRTGKGSPRPTGS